MKILCSKIEHLRQTMHVMALEKGVSHPDVLLASQMLDNAINELHELVLNQKFG